MLGNIRYTGVKGDFGQRLELKEVLAYGGSFSGGFEKEKIGIQIVVKLFQANHTKSCLHHLRVGFVI